MTREQIEKEIDSRLDEPDCEWDGIFNSGYSKGFREGAQWRINSVWHDASEKPNGNNKCLVELRIPGRRNPTYKLWTKGWKNNFVTRWAYVSDLLPHRKEKTNGGR